MSFRIGVSGLNAASTDLSVTADNIANSNTNGFKQLRTEFSDVVAKSIAGSNLAGDGVQLSRAVPDFVNAQSPADDKYRKDDQRQPGDVITEYKLYPALLPCERQ